MKRRRAWAWLRRGLEGFLRQGLSPERLALCLALGVTISCLPLPGATTTLCTLGALALRLNLPAMQLANYAAAPLQLLLYVPFLKAGQKVFGGPPLGLSLPALAGELRVRPVSALGRFWTWEWHAMAVWLAAAVPAAALLTLAIRPLLRRLPVPAVTENGPAG